MKKPKKIKSKLSKRALPKVIRREHSEETISNSLPIDHLSYSSMVQFTSNPLLFKIKYINKDRYDTTTGISGVIGQAFHKAMEVFYGNNPDMLPKNGSEAIEFGLKTGIDFIDKYEEGFISYSKTVPTKQKAQELFAFAFNSYAKEINNAGEEILSMEEEMCEDISIKWREKDLILPVKLKGYTDKIVRKDGKLIIKDYKTCRSFSDPEKIDASKIIQAVQYYLLTYAKYGEEPYSMIYEEVKLSKDAGGKQVRRYEIVYAENELYFDFYFRLYEDIVSALMGKMVYVPNVHTLFDNEVGVISYIHRLDVEEKKASEMKRLKVDNITDVLKKEIQSAGNMRKFMQTIEQQFCTAKNINYKTMKTEEKIATKLMEHGLLVQFDSVIEGLTVDLYRYAPSVGLKMSRLASFVADLEQVTGKTGIRVLAPIPGETLVGFEIPRDERRFVNLDSVKGKGFDLAVGQTIMGKERRFDIRMAPHLLVAGSSGSGKSVFLHSIIRQLEKLPRVQLHIFDPKQVELCGYTPFEYRCYHADIENALVNLTETMELRYELMRDRGVRSIETLTKIPYKFIIIDEYADLVARNGEIENNIQLLAQKGRACGIHLIIATQRASSRIINGDIKTNFPCKVVFRMAKEIDSRVMIDESGAEKLLGKGDCLFSNESGIERLQAYSVNI